MGINGDVARTSGTGKDLATRFQPGWGGGPGRPKGSGARPIVALIREALEGNILKGNTTPDGRSVAEWFADCLISNAMQGNAAAINQVMDRVEGKVTADPSAEAGSGAVFEIIDDGRSTSTSSTETVPPPAGSSPLPE